MKLRSKLIAAPLGTAIVALAAGAGYALWSQLERAAEVSAAQRAFQQAAALGEARTQVAAVHAGAYRVMAILASLDEAQVKAFDDSARQQLDAIGQSLAGMSRTESEGDGSRERLDALAAHLATYRTQVAKAIEMSSVDANMGVAAMKAADQGFARLTATMNEVVAGAEAASQLRQQDASRRAWWGAALSGLFAAVASAAALAVAWWMQRRLANDLIAAVDVSRCVAEGRLNVSVATDRTDEIGDLQRAQAEMVNRLRESLQTVQLASHGIGVASGEISSGNGDLRRCERTSALNR